MSAVYRGRTMMRGKDARAVENPISAVFDLADDVYDLTPKMRKMIRYATIFIFFSLIWTFILAIVFLVLFFWFGIFLLALLIVGAIALRLLRTNRKFLIYFEQRHRAIKSVRESNPEVKVPPGNAPVDRMIAYLKERNPEVREVLRRGALRTGTSLNLRSGKYNLDGYAYLPPALMWRLFGTDYSGFTLYIKSFDKVPTMADIKRLESVIKENSRLTGVAPGRIVVVLPQSAEGNISDVLYEYVTKHSIETRYFFSEKHCALQLAIESKDGTYDFIPFVADM